MGIRERVKTIRYITDPDSRGKPLEAHHLEQRHNGGMDTTDNLTGLTLPEHCLIHHIEADLATRKGETQTNFWAVSEIMQRMTTEEYQEYQRMLDIRRKRH